MIYTTYSTEDKVNSSCKGVGCTPRPLIFPAVQWRRWNDGTPRDKKDPKKADPAVFFKPKRQSSCTVTPTRLSLPPSPSSHHLLFRYRRAGATSRRRRRRRRRKYQRQNRIYRSHGYLTTLHTRNSATVKLSTPRKTHSVYVICANNKS